MEIEYHGFLGMFVCGLSRAPTNFVGGPSLSVDQSLDVLSAPFN